MHFYKTPNFISSLSRHLIWSASTKSREIFLTFDDGPIPGLTEYVLDTLDQYRAKATFFCVGDNIRKHPDLAAQLIERGHQAGNHTFNHLKGWSSENQSYYRNVDACQSKIDVIQPKSATRLFRPPYGQISPRQISYLKTHYQIIMWSVLAYDFDEAHTGRYSLQQLLAHTDPGSIVLFHDNYKAEKKLKYMLPRFLQYFGEKGFEFKKLDACHLHSKT